MNQSIRDLKSGTLMNHERCDTCRFGHQAGIDPANIGAPRNVECREGPGAAFVVAAGPQGVQTVTVMPTHPPEFSCGRYQLKTCEKTPCLQQ